MKKLPLVILALLSSIIAFAQTPAKKTTTQNKSTKTVPSKSPSSSKSSSSQARTPLKSTVKPVVKPTAKPTVKALGKAPVKKTVSKSTVKTPAKSVAKATVKSPAKPVAKAPVETPAPAPETPAAASGKEKVKQQGQKAAKAIKSLGSNLFKGKSKKGEDPGLPNGNQGDGGSRKEASVKEVATAKKTDPVAKVTGPVRSGGASRISKASRGAGRPARVQGSSKPGGASRGGSKVKVTKVVKGRK